MKNDSDSERDEVLCLNSDHLGNVCSSGRHIDNDIKKIWSNFNLFLWK